MAKYRVIGPDGAVYMINAPDDATPDQVQQYARYATSNEGGAPSAAKEVGPLEAFGIGYSRTGDRLVKGVQQAYHTIRGDQAALDSLEQKSAEDTAQYDKLRKERPIATALGEATPLAALALPATGALGAIAAGALPGLVEYGTANDKLRRGLLGGASGAAGVGLAKLLGRATSDTVKTADAVGTPLTPGQATQSTPVLALESVLQRLPGSSSRMSKIYDMQRQALNRTAMERAGGEGISKLSPEVVEQVGSQVGGKLGAEAAKIPQVALDDVALNSLAEVERRYGLLLDAQQRPVFQRVLDDLINKSASGELTGESYQMIRSALSQKVKGLQGVEKNAFGGILKALDDAAVRSAPEGVGEAMLKARGQYRNLKSIEDLITPSGDLSARRMATRAMKPGAFSPEMRDAANFARLISETTPDSGTPIRKFWQDLLTKPDQPLLTLGNVAGATGVPWALANTLTRAPVRSAVSRGLLEVSPEMERELLRAGGLLGIGVGNYATQ